MPLIRAKDRYIEGDLIVVLQKCRFPEKSRLSRYGLDLEKTDFLDVRVGHMRTAMGSIHHFVRMAGFMYFNPNFYSGIGFKKPAFVGTSYLIKVEDIVGAVAGTLDRTDSEEVESLLRSIIKSYRGFLSEQFSDMILKRQLQDSKPLPASFFDFFDPL